jgi:purine-binding chemotaxis protein CheW
MSEIAHDLMLSLVVFSIADQRYALNLPVVERVVCMVEVSPLPKAPVIVLGVINFHGQIIPVIDIRRRFGHSPNHYGLNSCLLVAQTSRRKLALSVDKILGVQEVPSENVTLPDAVLPGTGLVAGIAALSDGVLLIHDLDTFLSLDEEQRLTEALEGKAE